MYLSKVMISGSACRNPYEIHRVLWKLFPHDDDAERDFLFRIERSGQQKAEILLQSLREPVNTVEREVRIIGSKPYPLHLNAGQRLRYFLLANPVKTISDEGGRLNAGGEIKKCRVPLIRDEELQSWLVRKLEGCVSVEMVQAEKRPPLNFRKAIERRAGKIQPSSFQGTLIVVDPEGLKKMVASGIGPAKAFGCGLLSLAKL
ncbi:MAG TPA: type I-E CRISPR-associated protein Cas6/Cse3/CasE [Acidobacteriota bacterium]|nr:type I-E CRISPR-associated protein Cas6/Cse3/CasE [Acidobacteriota bacterium]